MRVERPGPPHRPKAPDVAQALALGEDPIRLRGKPAKPGELAVAPPPPPIAAHRRPSHGVDAQLTEADRPGAMPGPPSQHRRDTRDELGIVERLPEVVVSAGLEAA